MKKILLVCMAAMMVANVWAQTAESKDLIYTSDNKVVEAKVVEVSSKEIKYKDWNNPDGPVFVLTADEVQKVQFSNGTEKTFAAPVQAAPSRTEGMERTVATESQSAPSQKASKPNMSMRFQMNADIEGNLTYLNRSRIEGATVNSYAFGGVSAILGAGIRMNNFLYLGAAAGAMGEWGKPKVTYKGKEFVANSSAYIVPIYADARVYAPNNSICFPFVEVGVGGFVGLNGQLKSDQIEDGTYKINGGFYFVSGVGLEFNILTIGAGYKLLRNDQYNSNISHGYVKIGVSFGRAGK